jgi:hypothetical protein
MTRELPARAVELAAKLARLFEADVELVERLNDAQRRLRHANDQLWSGLYPDALGLVYDDPSGVAGGGGTSTLVARLTDVLRGDWAEREADIVPLAALQRTHWAIHRAFVDHQSACEERRQLEVDVGEFSQQLIAALAVAGWSEEAARSADVHELAKAGAR